MSDHSKYVIIASKLIKNNGRNIEVLGFNELSDAEKPWNRKSFEILVNIKAAFISTGGDNLGLNFISDDLLKRVNGVFLYAGNFNFENAQAINDNDKIYKIIWIQELKPGNTIILNYIGIKQ